MGVREKGALGADRTRAWVSIWGLEDGEGDSCSRWVLTEVNRMETGEKRGMI